MDCLVSPSPSEGKAVKARTVEPDKQSLLGNSCVTRNNGVTVGIGVFCVSVPRLYKEDKLPLRASLETADRGVGGWCELAASL
jgi:hypothetical protein